MRYLVLLLLIPFFTVAQELTESTNLDITLSWSQVPDGYTYPVYISVPDGTAPTEGYPVCITLHGNGGNGAQQVESMSQLLDCHIVIAPSGYANSWFICSEESNGPDMQMLESLIASIKSYSNVNANRIRLVGGSNGSALVNNFYIQNDDPSVDRVCGIVSQMNEPQFHNGDFHFPATGPNENEDFCGYNTPKDLQIGRKYLSICNDNDNLIPFEGGPSPIGLSFLPAEFSVFKVAQSQGYTGDQLPPGGEPIGNPLIFEYKYLDGDVVLLRGNAQHGTNSSQRNYLKEWLGDCDFSSNTVGVVEADIDLYPNPFSSVLNIDLIGISSTDFKLIGIDGKQVYKGVLVEGSQELDLHLLPNGVYVLHFSGLQRLIVKQ